MTHRDPIVLALMVCDSVIEDKATGNKSLVNTFNAIAAPRFPTRHARMFVFVQLTGGRGKVPVVLELIDPDNQGLMALKGELDFKDPTAVLDLVFDIRGLVFPKAGQYRFEVRAGDEAIAQRPFSLIERAQ